MAMDRTVIPFVSRTTTSISTLLDRKRTGAWPEPEKSIGGLRATIKGKKCWEAKGPALEAFNKVAYPIQKLLDDRRDFLEEGEEIARPISYQIWMVGRNVESALPTIVFASKSKRSRTKATIIVKENDILAEFPGIAMKALSAIPAVPKADIGNHSQHPQETDEDDVSTIGYPQHACGAPIIVGGGRKATLGGVLLIGGGWYGITANHARFGDIEEPSDLSECSREVSFDDDSDLEEDAFIEITSKGSVSSSASSDTGYDFSGSDEDNTSSMVEDTSVTRAVEVPYPSPFAGCSEDKTPSKPCRRRKISTMTSPRIRNDIDYEIFPIEDIRYCAANKVYLPSDGVAMDSIKVDGVAEELAERPVWVATGTTGTIKGVIKTSNHFIKMAGSQTFQEMWAVQLQRHAISGDCGSWVVDAETGMLYGYIVADDPLTGLAYIIPAKNVFGDIRRRLGKEVWLPVDNVDTGHAISRAQLAERQCHAEKMSMLSSAATQSLHLARKFSAIRQTSSNTECTSATFEQGVKCSELLPLLADVDEFETRNPRPYTLSYHSIFFMVLSGLIGTGIFCLDPLMTSLVSQSRWVDGVPASILIETIAALRRETINLEKMRERRNSVETCEALTGDIIWMLISALVVLMALGAGISHSCFARRKSTHLLSLMATAIVSSQWLFWDYSTFVYRLLRTYSGDIITVTAGAIACFCFKPGSHSYRYQAIHIKGIAFAGTVGIGLFVQIGHFVQPNNSPIGCMVVYIVAGAFCWSVMTCLGEMAQLYSIRGRILDYPHRFVHEELGFAVGWIYWWTWTSLFWIGLFSITQYLPTSFGRELLCWKVTWVPPLLVLLGSMPFPTYHWIEKILGYMKMACLCSIIPLTIVLTVHATSKEPTTAFSVNNSPTGVLRQRFFFSMDPEMDSQIGGTLLPIWIWMSLIIFCWIGIEVVAVDKIDNAKHKYLLREAKRTQVRCLLDYTLACFLMGLDISCQDTSIADPVSNSAQWRDGSSFTAAIRGHFRFWPYPLGALAILSFISTANSALYISSRILYSLALVESRWPRGSLTQPLQNHLRKTTTSGVPVYALIVTLLFGGLDYQLMKTFAVQVDYHVSDAFQQLFAGFMLVLILSGYVNWQSPFDTRKLLYSNELKSTRLKSNVRRSWAGLGMCAFSVLTIPVIGSGRTWVNISYLLACYLPPVMCFTSFAIWRRREMKLNIQRKYGDGFAMTRMGTEDCGDDPDTGELKRERFRDATSTAADELVASQVSLFSGENVKRVAQWVWDWLK